jgi:CDP-2,3-bis-(O-geranylgeranyl)-sn-glycerol synthase
VSDLALVAALFGPLFVGLALHGLCIRYGWWPVLTRPIDGGRRLRGRRLFGENKTYRGVVAVALGTAGGFAIEAWLLGSLPGRLAAIPTSRLVVFGMVVGAAAMLSELPNSLVKRQLGVSPGSTATGALGVAFYFVDQIDFLIGAWLVVAAVVRPTVSLCAWSVAFVFVVHQIITVADYRLGMRATFR